MLIDSKFKVRNKILKVLREQTIPYDNTEFVNLYDMQLTILELSMHSKLASSKIIEQVDYLYSVKEIEITWINDEARYHITPQGTIALYDNKYIEMGKAKRFSTIKETVTLCSAVIITCIALFSFLQNYMTTKENNESIKEIKKQLIKIGIKENDRSLKKNDPTKNN